MNDTPFQLKYTLNRRQRFIPHICVWGPFSIILPAICVGIIVIAAHSTAWAAALLLPLFFLFRGFFIGLINVMLFRVCQMDILVEKNGLGFVAGKERFYIFLDGITSITKYCKDVWTIKHWNGTVVNILASVITDDQIEYLTTAMERGRTPEGIQDVIERGRIIEQLTSGKLKTPRESNEDD
jgi:hypothetical protein